MAKLIKPGGLITSRQDTVTKVAIFLAIFFCLSMIALSAYNIAVNIFNATAWAMLILFAYLMTGILLYEENAFPTLPKQKWISFMISWAALFFGVPLLVSFITSMNLSLLFIAAIFLIPAAFAIFHMISTETQWKKTMKTLKQKLPKRKKKRKVRRFK